MDVLCFYFVQLLRYFKLFLPLQLIEVFFLSEKILTMFHRVYGMKHLIDCPKSLARLYFFNVKASVPLWQEQAAGKPIPYTYYLCFIHVAACYQMYKGCVFIGME